MSYYERSNIVHLDGTQIFQNETDRSNEDSVAGSIEARWNCKLHRFGALSPIDWYAERDGRVVGVLDLKSRTHPSDQFSTVFLNVRKWLALIIGGVGLKCPALFVVKFSDGVRWVKVAEVDASNVQIGGCMRRVKSESDVEPVILVPIKGMAVLREGSPP